MTSIVKLDRSSPTAVQDAQRIVNLMRFHGQEKHPVLVDVRRDVFYGGTVWVLYDDPQEGDLEPVPLSIHVTKLGKRKKNVWEPYANWYTAYTLPDERRKGYATQLYKAMEAEAAEMGCRRVKSLAGSYAGAKLHLSLNHICWGETDNNELWFDTPLPEMPPLLYMGLTPPQAPQAKPMSKSVIEHIININNKRGLRYDKA